MMDESITQKLDDENQEELNSIYFFGDKSPIRWLAVFIDNLIATFLAVILTGIFVDMLSGIAFLVLVCIIYAAYFVICEGLWSRTLGKKMCGLIVVNKNLENISWSQSLIRNTIRIIEVNPVTGILIGSFFVCLHHAARELEIWLQEQ